MSAKIRIKSFNDDLVDLTEGKQYKVDNDFGDGDLGLFDDSGFWFITRIDEPCSFLNGGEWEVIVE